MDAIAEPWPTIDFKKKEVTTKVTKRTQVGREPSRAGLIRLGVLPLFVVSFS
jgi:hypothetical protein